MRYTLTIKLPLLVSIGVFDEERITKQYILLDIKISNDKLIDGCFSDEINDVFCYEKIIKEITILAESKHFNLIEHFTFKIIELLKTKFRNESLLVKATKFPIYIDKKFSVSFIIDSSMNSDLVSS